MTTETAKKTVERSPCNTKHCIRRLQLVLKFVKHKRNVPFCHLLQLILGLDVLV